MSEGKTNWFHKQGNYYNLCTNGKSYWIVDKSTGDLVSKYPSQDPFMTEDQEIAEREFKFKEAQAWSLDKYGEVFKKLADM